MRILNAQRGKYTYVEVNDDPGAGGANHSYSVYGHEEGRPAIALGVVNFQKGPIKENGVNGLMNEDLLAILIDRLAGFQSGPYACRENELAQMDVEHALEVLQSRTKKREERGVEGTSTI